MIARPAKTAATAHAIGTATSARERSEIANPTTRNTKAVARKATNSQTVSSASSVRCDNPSRRP